MSTRTVNTPVHTILNKTAVANRTEAAAYATRRTFTALKIAFPWRICCNCGDAVPIHLAQSV